MVVLTAVRWGMSSLDCISVKVTEGITLRVVSGGRTLKFAVFEK